LLHAVRVGILLQNQRLLYDKVEFKSSDKLEIKNSVPSHKKCIVSYSRHHSLDGVTEVNAVCCENGN